MNSSFPDVKCSAFFFTNEKVFYMIHPINNSFDALEKFEVATYRILIKRSKFAPHVMVSVGSLF